MDLVEKLIVAYIRVVKKLPDFYATQIFSTVFTGFRHWIQSRAKLLHSEASKALYLRRVLISHHSCLCLPSVIFSSRFPIKLLYTFLASPFHVTCLTLISDLTNACYTEELNLENTPFIRLINISKHVTQLIYLGLLHLPLNNTFFLQIYLLFRTEFP
jgi:hypothetical protein